MRRSIPKIVLILSIITYCSTQFPRSYDFSALYANEWRAASVPNSNIFTAVAIDDLETLTLGRFDVENDSVTSFPSLSDYTETVTPMPTSLTNYIHLTVGVPGWPIPLPYTTLISGTPIIDPIKSLLDEEIYNILPRKSFSGQDKLNLIAEMFPVTEKAIVVSERFLSINTKQSE